MRRDVISNAFWSMGAYGLTLAVGLFYTPYLVRHLGIAQYGLIPLISSLLVWTSLITIALNWSVGRFLILEEQRGDADAVNRIFNTSLFVTLAALGGVLVLGLLATLRLDWLIRVPPEQAIASQWLFLYLVGAFILNLVAGVFEVFTFCKNRYDLRALLQICRTLLTTLGVVAVFTWLGPTLPGLGLVNLGVALVMVGVTFGLFRWQMSEVRLGLRWMSLPWLSQMWTKNMWVVADQVGTTLMLNMDLILVNRLFSPQLTGDYALVLQWATMVRATMNACNVFSPTYVQFVGREDLAGLRAYAVKASRLIGTVIALLVGIILGAGTDLFLVWLKHPLPIAAVLIPCMFIPLAINAAVNPLYGVWHAFYQVRMPCIATVVSGVGGIVLAVGLVRGVGCGVWAVAIAGALAFLLRDAFFSIPYASRLMGGTLWPFVRESLVALLAALVVAGVFRLGSHWWPVQSWGTLLRLAVPIGAVYAVWACWRITDYGQRRRAVASFRSRLQAMAVRS